MYERRSRLSSRQQAELIKFFVAGSTARAAGEIVAVHGIQPLHILCGFDG